MSVVWAIFVPRGVSLLGLASVSVVGLVVLVMSALWAGYRPARSISEILQETDAEPLAVPAPARISKDPS
jgi:hypothetical protein